MTFSAGSRNENCTNSIDNSRVEEGEMGMVNGQTIDVTKPCALFLTHRKGAVVLVVRSFAGLEACSYDLDLSVFAKINEDFKIETSYQHNIMGHLLQTWQLWLGDETLWVRRGSQSTLAKHKYLTKTIPSGAVISWSLEHTAECLQEMYFHSLQSLKLEEEDMNQIIVGVGPGSFTGIRIGCAFANGLFLGRKRLLFDVPCATVKEFCTVLTQNPVDDLLAQQLANLDINKNEAFSALGLLDVIFGVGFISSCRSLVNGTLVPKYGQEPGPVLKLKEGQSG